MNIVSVDNTVNSNNSDNEEEISDITLLHLQCKNMKKKLERKKKEYLQKLCYSKFRDFGNSFRNNINSESYEEYVQIFFDETIEVLDADYELAVDSDVYSGNVLTINFGNDDGKLFILSFITGISKEYNSLTIEDDEYYLIDDETINESNPLYDTLYSIHEKMVVL